MQHKVVASLAAMLVAGSLAAATPAKKAAPAAAPLAAPETFPHPIAMFLANLSGDGAKKVSFKATAVDKRFFFEEASGVTVYLFDGGAYKRETFLKGYTLARAVKHFETTKAAMEKKTKRS